MLGKGLGDWRLSTDAAAPLTGVSMEAVSGAVVASELVDLPFIFDLVRFETGSSVTMRALGAGKGAMSIFSKKLTRLRQVIVGFIVVGRVMVDVKE